jgi:hypothetical protein
VPYAQGRPPETGERSCAALGQKVGTLWGSPDTAHFTELAVQQSR